MTAILYGDVEASVFAERLREHLHLLAVVGGIHVQPVRRVAVFSSEDDDDAHSVTFGDREIASVSGGGGVGSDWKQSMPVNLQKSSDTPVGM